MELAAAVKVPYLEGVIVATIDCPCTISKMMQNQTLSVCPLRACFSLQVSKFYTLRLLSYPPLIAIVPSVYQRFMPLVCPSMVWISLPLSRSHNLSVLLPLPRITLIPSANTAQQPTRLVSLKGVDLHTAFEVPHLKGFCRNYS